MEEEEGKEGTRRRGRGDKEEGRGYFFLYSLYVAVGL